MAQFVKLEPGDILVLANLGEWDESFTEALMLLKDKLGLDHVLAFEGGVDLSKVSTDVAGFARLYLNNQVVAQEAARTLSDESGDGG